MPAQDGATMAKATATIPRLGRLGGGVRGGRQCPRHIKV